MNSILNYIDESCLEIAFELYDEFKEYGDTYDEKAVKFFKNAKKNGVRDIANSYADHLYNDPDNLECLLGDKLYDMFKGNKNQIREFCQKNIKTTNVSSLKMALKKIGERYGTVL